jgi:hypothetical protein
MRRLFYPVTFRGHHPNPKGNQIMERRIAAVITAMVNRKNIRMTFFM